MAIHNHKPISHSLSVVLKKSLTTLQIRLIADRYGVHYNTIINIRDRRKKSPDNMIVRHMIKMSILTQNKSIKEREKCVTLLKQELEKLK